MTCRRSFSFVPFGVGLSTSSTRGIVFRDGIFRSLLLVLVCLSGLRSAAAQGGGELRFCLHAEPKTFDPLKVEDDASASIRYLTGGVLLRLNRRTQAVEPELAQSWKLSNAITDPWGWSQPIAVTCNDGWSS